MRTAAAHLESSAEPFTIEEKTVHIESAEQQVEFAWTPSETGRFVVTASTEPQSGELVTQNNRAEREVSIRDDFLRLMFVEYEPTWEWRFIKEVFHRDKLVGPDGLGREPGRAVRPDQQGQLGQQLRHVEAELEVGGGHVTVTGIKQDDAAIAGEHDAVRGQGPVRDAVCMQLQDGLPYPQQLVIGRR